LDATVATNDTILPERSNNENRINKKKISLKKGKATKWPAE